uniref:Uncharacterized protein n=1 Tax=Cacopsylla melanoneura TaxID=428564 RepID=A0A8D8YVL7_9HEMI
MATKVTNENIDSSTTSNEAKVKASKIAKDDTAKVAKSVVTKENMNASTTGNVVKPTTSKVLKIATNKVTKTDTTKASKSVATKITKAATNKVAKAVTTKVTKATTTKAVKGVATKVTNATTTKAAKGVTTKVTEAIPTKAAKANTSITCSQEVTSSTGHYQLPAQYRQRSSLGRRILKIASATTNPGESNSSTDSSSDQESSSDSTDSSSSDEDKWVEPEKFGKKSSTKKPPESFRKYPASSSSDEEDRWVEPEQLGKKSGTKKPPESFRKSPACSKNSQSATKRTILRERKSRWQSLDSEDASLGTPADNPCTEIGGGPHGETITSRVENYPPDAENDRIAGEKVHKDHYGGQYRSYYDPYYYSGQPIDSAYYYDPRYIDYLYEMEQTGAAADSWETFDYDYYYGTAPAAEYYPPRIACTEYIRGEDGEWVEREQEELAYNEDVDLFVGMFGSDDPQDGAVWVRYNYETTREPPPSKQALVERYQKSFVMKSLLNSGQEQEVAEGERGRPPVSAAADSTEKSGNSVTDGTQKGAHSDVTTSRKSDLRRGSYAEYAATAKAKKKSAESDQSILTSETRPPPGILFRGQTSVQGSVFDFKNYPAPEGLDIDTAAADVRGSAEAALSADAPNPTPYDVPNEDLISKRSSPHNIPDENEANVASNCTQSINDVPRQSSLPYDVPNWNDVLNVNNSNPENPVVEGSLLSSDVTNRSQTSDDVRNQSPSNDNVTSQYSCSRQEDEAVTDASTSIAEVKASEGSKLNPSRDTDVETSRVDSHKGVEVVDLSKTNVMKEPPAAKSACVDPSEPHSVDVEDGVDSFWDYEEYIVSACDPEELLYVLGSSSWAPRKDFTDWEPPKPEVVVVRPAFKFTRKSRRAGLGFSRGRRTGAGRRDPTIEQQKCAWFTKEVAKLRTKRERTLWKFKKEKDFNKKAELMFEFRKARRKLHVVINRNKKQLYGPIWRKMGKNKGPGGRGGGGGCVGQEPVVNDVVDE